jgi:hypothetical protein
MQIGNKVASFDVDAQNTFTPLCPNELPVPGGTETDGLIYKRPLSDRPVLDKLLEKIERPVSKRQLVDLGFRWWRGDYDDVQLDEMSRAAAAC